MYTFARILGGEGGHGTCTAHPKVLQLLHIAAFKSQRNFCNGHAGIWDAVLRHNRTMRWLQSYGLLVIQDQKIHSTVIKVPTVFKTPPPHPPRNLSQMLELQRIVFNPVLPFNIIYLLRGRKLIHCKKWYRAHPATGNWSTQLEGHLQDKRFGAKGFCGDDRKLSSRFRENTGVGLCSPT